MYSCLLKGVISDYLLIRNSSKKWPIYLGYSLSTRAKNCGVILFLLQKNVLLLCCYKIAENKQENNWLGLRKEWGLEQETKVYPRFLIKFCFCFCFLPASCIFPDYMGHEITKEFWKNSHFENITAGFLQRCQNLHRYFTPDMMHFQAWKKLIFTNIAL